MLAGPVDLQPPVADLLPGCPVQLQGHALLPPRVSVSQHFPPWLGFLPEM